MVKKEKTRKRNKKNNKKDNKNKEKEKQKIKMQYEIRDHENLDKIFINMLTFGSASLRRICNFKISQFK